jgi:hypothetical protein
MTFWMASEKYNLGYGYGELIATRTEAAAVVWNSIYAAYEGGANVQDVTTALMEVGSAATPAQAATVYGDKPGRVDDDDEGSAYDPYAHPAGQDQWTHVGDQIQIPNNVNNLRLADIMSPVPNGIPQQIPIYNIPQTTNQPMQTVNGNWTYSDDYSTVEEYQEVMEAEYKRETVIFISTMLQMSAYPIGLASMAVTGATTVGGLLANQAIKEFIINGTINAGITAASAGMASLANHDFEWQNPGGDLVFSFVTGGAFGCLENT